MRELPVRPPRIFLPSKSVDAELRVHARSLLIPLRGVVNNLVVPQVETCISKLAKLDVSLMLWGKVADYLVGGGSCITTLPKF